MRLIYMRLYKDDFNKLGFCDFDVLKMHLEKNTRTMYIKVQGASYKTGEKVAILNNVNIKIYFWKLISIGLTSKNKIIYLDENNYDPLREICEARMIDDVLILNGFGENTSLWVEYKFSSPQIEIIFENSEEKETMVLKEIRLYELSKLVSDFLRTDILIGSEYKLEPDENGWVLIAELLPALYLKSKECKNLSETDLIEMTKLFHHPIFEIQTGKIRAIGSTRIHELLTASLKKLLSEPSKPLLTPSSPEAIVNIKFYETTKNKSSILSEIFRTKVEIDNKRHTAKLYLSNMGSIHLGEVNENIPIKFLCWFLVSSRVYEGKKFRLLKIIDMLVKEYLKK